MEEIQRLWTRKLCPLGHEGTSCAAATDLNNHSTNIILPRAHLSQPEEAVALPAFVRIANPPNGPMVRHRLHVAIFGLLPAPPHVIVRENVLLPLGKFLV